MTDTEHPLTFRNSETDESWQQSQTQAREAAQTEPPPTFGDVGQGPRGDINADAITTSNLGNFAWFTEHKADIMAAHAAGLLPGQANHTTTPLDN